MGIRPYIICKFYASMQQLEPLKGEGTVRPRIYLFLTEYITNQVRISRVLKENILLDKCRYVEGKT